MLREIGTVVPIFSENCELSVPVQRKTLLVYFLQGFEKTNLASTSIDIRSKFWISIQQSNFKKLGGVLHSLCIISWHCGGHTFETTLEIFVKSRPKRSTKVDLRGPRALQEILLYFSCEAK